MISIRERGHTSHEGEGESKEFAAEGVDCFHIAIIYRLYIGVSYGVPIVIYRISNVYLSYIYRISTVIDSGEIAYYRCVMFELYSL